MDLPDLIKETIENADLDEYDKDAATNGLCGTFALALQSVFPESELGLLCLTKDGSILKDTDGTPFWVHALTMCNNRLFDADGEVILDDLKANYCEYRPNYQGAAILPISREKLTFILKDDNKSFDEYYFEEWTKKLASCYEPGSRLVAV